MRKYSVIAILLLVVMLSGCTQTPVHSINYNNRSTSFRADLNKASLVPVYPHELVLRDMLLDPSIQLINITFVSNQTENPFFAVGAFELSYKLNLIKQAENLHFVVNATEIPSQEDIIPVENTIYIFLSGPSLSSATSVQVEENIIYLSGASFQEDNRKYTDLDLAIDKLLLVLMEE